MPIEKVAMLHPKMKNREGKTKIFHINKRTVDSGKAAKMGFEPIQEAEQPPINSPEKLAKGIEKIMSTPTSQAGKEIPSLDIPKIKPTVTPEPIIEIPKA